MGYVLLPLFLAGLGVMLWLIAVFALFGLAVIGQCAQFLLDLIIESDKRAVLNRLRRPRR